MNTQYYQRKLPHIQPTGGTFFVTFRLAGSLPVAVLRQLQENHALLERGILSCEDLTETERRKLAYAAQKQLFTQTDACLDHNPNGPYWLRDAAIRALVEAELQRHVGSWYTLWAYCIMPNHVHVLLTALENAPTLTKMLQNIKGYSAQKANSLLGRSGQFWERESYDHLVRDEQEFERIVFYILRNPLKAGLVKQWADWPGTYLNPVLSDTLLPVL